MEFHGYRPACRAKPTSIVHFSFWDPRWFLSCSPLRRRLLRKLHLPKFEDVAKQVGLTVSHISSPDKRYIVESMSGGVGLIDCDNDGKLDIITVNGSTVDRYKQGGDPHDHALSSGRRLQIH